MKTPGDEILEFGPWSALFQHSNGMLRNIAWKGFPVLAGIVAPVRDINWGTVKAQLSRVKRTIAQDSLEIGFQAHCSKGSIDFHWNGLITFHTSGKLLYQFAGRANSSFQSRRIGFCVLHSYKCAGSACKVTHTDGEVENSSFPKHISPYQVFTNIRAIEYDPLPGIRAETLMEGDVFEMEDQRNWSDASFKTYCTPLSLPGPRTIKRDSEINQKVVVSIIDSGLDRTSKTETESSRLVISDPGQPEYLPILGISLGNGRTKTAGQPILRSGLKELNPSFISLLVDAVNRGNEIANDLKSLLINPSGPVELILKLSSTNFGNDARALANDLKEAVLQQVVRIVLLVSSQNVPSPEQFREARAILGIHFPEAKWAGGAEHNFTELNRSRPEAGDWDGVSFSFNPQVHAFDDKSILETIPIVDLLARECRQLYPAKQLHLTPVTICPRIPEFEGGDKRLSQSLGAIWTLGVIASASGEANTLTIHDLTGNNGIMSGENPETPVFRLLKEVFAVSGQPRVSLSIPGNPDLVCLGIKKGEEILAWIANGTEATAVIELEEVTPTGNPRVVFGGQPILESGKITLPAMGCCHICFLEKTQ